MVCLWEKRRCAVRGFSLEIDKEIEANAIPDNSGAHPARAYRGPSPGDIGNCICPGIAFGGEHEYGASKQASFIALSWIDQILSHSLVLVVLGSLFGLHTHHSH